MLLEWDHDAAGEADQPAWAREATAGTLRVPRPGQHGPATRRALRAQRMLMGTVVGAVALALWAVLWPA
jgi:cell division septal protein FtsQ